MRGAVAAGHEITAQAGARALEEGGNAVDACIAAAFASWVAESPLTGPGAGGFMLVHRAQDRSRRLLDFFVAAPGQGLPARAGRRDGRGRHPLRGLGRTTQRFLIGHASCAVPGTVAGLAAAHRSYGTMPWQRARGACDRARARRRRDDEGAGAAARAARLDPPAHARGQGRVRPARPGSWPAIGSSRPISPRRSRCSRRRGRTRSIAASSARRSRRTCRSTEERSRVAISRRTA